MALEDTIAANTAAVIALTAQLAKGSVEVTNNTVVTTADVPAITKALANAASVAAGIAVTAAGQPELAAAASVVAQTTVTDVLNAAMKLIAAKGKPTLQETLKEFNAKSIQVIAPENLKAALDKINAAIEAPAA